MKGTLTKICRAGFLSSFILVSYIAMTSSMTFDLTELRNKVSKIKVNPRGNLWATGHFMGKKSVVDNSFMESAFEDEVNVPTGGRAARPSYRVEDLQDLLIEMLKTARQAHRKQAADIFDWISPKVTLDICTMLVGYVADSQKEKNVRASLKAEVERKVNKDHIVILDSLNYIKGYRYELFCLIKHAQTPHCLVYCLTSDEESSTWNTNRGAAEQYTQDIFDALVLRFEAPDSRNRWDSPLFTILKDDTMPYEAISDALFKRKAPPPNQSTQSQPLSSANFLYELDKITQDVLMVCLQMVFWIFCSFVSHSDFSPGILFFDRTSLSFERPSSCLIMTFRFFWVDPRTDRLVRDLNLTFNIKLTRSVNMAELRKLRRQFISYTKMHPTENTGQISNMFVQYLNKSLH
ncbi:hypothetical protein L3Q82_023935 [Scortum barcoo]|uniref:Uncharacterized protein n=1 Tax=Scortum barcoo TaxID=214431 RepID=A0ACB8WUJ0_9TELE|nr:hypothetical protein L3Q82_023935 [Scortum barcoo]